MAKRIVFTGGSGKAGRHVVPWLRNKGYEILNLDLKPLDCEGVNTLITDVTDSGQVFNALSMHHWFDGYDSGKGPARNDAVVHFAAIPRVLMAPDISTMRRNSQAGAFPVWSGRSAVLRTGISTGPIRLARGLSAAGRPRSGGSRQNGLS